MQAAVKTKKPRKQAVSGRFWAGRTYRERIKDDHKIDPACGSGSLLLTVKHYLSEDKKKTLHYFGQELNTATYNLARMNLLLHGVKPGMMDVHNGDTLAEDWPEDPERPGEGCLFDTVVMIISSIISSGIRSKQGKPFFSSQLYLAKAA